MQTVFIHTFGCQMNESDSLRMLEALSREGWGTAAGPESADLILLNTCAIREKAEQKLYSALGRYRAVKERRGALLAVAGCVAQQEKARLIRRAPYVDFVLGPDNLAALPELARAARAGSRRQVATDWMDEERYVFPRADPEGAQGATAFVTAMKGCDNVCSFCVVPHTRGRELSRPYPEIVTEVARLAEVGVREVTLIGQNVNSFSGGCDFPSLLRRIGEVPGLRRLRFTTSHPHDFGEALVRCFAELPVLCPHLHLPVQSGSDRVLARMRRDYSAAEYEAKVASLRAAAPRVALTSDVIVGFPGETEEDFEATLQLVARVRYDNLFSFAYSSRPHTAARLREVEWGVLPQGVKIERLERLQSLQRAITLETMQRTVGAEVEVLVEGRSRTDPERLCGHTPENRMVNLDGEAPVGSLAAVAVETASAAALSGRILRVIEGPTFVAAPPRRLSLPIVA
ncbi:MAG: tRNA (N6-isopentenyl adenosine(37)-C2)-methylthiotransferase MiaB [Myxococcales bacterium]